MTYTADHFQKSVYYGPLSKNLAKWKYKWQYQGENRYGHIRNEISKTKLIPNSLGQHRIIYPLVMPE